MAEVAIDANVLVGLLYDGDALHTQAVQLLDQLERDGHDAVLFDFLIQEAVSVLCRRTVERKANPPNLRAAVETVRGWYDAGEVRFAAREAERLAAAVLDVVVEGAGVLNFNDGLVVLLQREGLFDQFATFDKAFSAVADFQRVL